ncbi:hypothetical protein SDC9_148990 [bioreactor metagenome]|uniref:Uncharacterized protein n=1 Tax=bioreactor metagenome TaxID=1076179 RepID=A0A645EIE1_9ZZZZ
MSARDINLIQAVPYPFRAFQVYPGNSRHAHDRIHRRTNIVRHGRQKVSFGRVGHTHCLIGVLKSYTLPLLFLSFLCNIQSYTVKGRDTIPAIQTIHITHGNGQDTLFP